MCVGWGWVRRKEAREMGWGVGLATPCGVVPRNWLATADSTLRTSRAVPHPSTTRALCRLTSEVERDPVHSTRYGRQNLPSPAMVVVVDVGHKKGHGHAAECGGEKMEKDVVVPATYLRGHCRSRHCR